MTVVRCSTLKKNKFKMLFIVFSSLLGWFLYIFSVVFKKFKWLHENIPKRITSAQTRKLKSSIHYASHIAYLRATTYPWSVDLLLCMMGQWTLNPLSAFILLSMSIAIYYSTSQDLGRLGIITSSYSIVHSWIVFPLHVCIVYHTLTYPLQIKDDDSLTPE